MTIAFIGHGYVSLITRCLRFGEHRLGGRPTRGDENLKKGITVFEPDSRNGEMEC
jgi:hypothetical protein